MTIKPSLLTSISLALGLALGSGCGSKPSEDETTGEESSSGAESSTGQGGTGQIPTTSADTGEVGSSTGPVCEMADPNGEGCSDACDCMSGECFVVDALGGVCSDCDSDEDCADSTGFGCNFGNPLTGVPAVCSETGDLGEGCTSDDVCAEGLLCKTLIEVPGIISAATCSECLSDSDCMMGQLCAPTYDIEAIAGHFRCVDAGSIPDDEGCDFMSDTGNDQCESGNCSPAAIMGVPVVGVCSPCNEDSDCPGMGTCQFPELGLDGTMLVLMPGECI